MKKALSLILALLLLLGLLPQTVLTASAEEMPGDVGMLVQGQHWEAQPGATVAIQFHLSGNTGFSYLQLGLEYDSDVFEFVKATNGTVATEDFASSATSVLWFEMQDTYENGLLVTLTFRIKEGTPEGVHSVGATVTECFDEYFENVSLTVEAGTVTIGHNYEYTEIAPTCTEQGVVCERCVNCGDIKSQEYLPARGHLYSYAVSTTPTTQAGGALAGTCQRCAGTVTVELPALNTGDYTYQVIQEPTYKEYGVGLYTWNNRAYGTFSFEVPIDMLIQESNMMLWAENTTAPFGETFTVRFYVNGNPGFSFLRLKLEYDSDIFEFVSATNGTVSTEDFQYSNSILWLTAADTTENGLLMTVTFRVKEGATERDYSVTADVLECYNYNYDAVSMTVEAGVVSVTHSYEATVFEPTCTEDGYTRYTCAGCGDSYVTDIVDALGHYYTYEVSAVPTHYAEGALEGDCVRCDATMAVVMPRLNETDYTYTVIQAPTYTEIGWGRFTWNNHDYGIYFFDQGIDMLDPTVYPTVRPESVTAKVGDTVTVRFYLSDNTGFSYLRLSLEYDSNVLEYVKATNGDVSTEDFMATGTNLLWASSEDALENGLLVTVTFRVKAEAAEGNYSIGAIIRECYNQHDDIVSMEVETGTMTVSHCYEAVVTEATCLDGGYTTYTCLSCGDSYVQDYVEALGHAYDITVVEPTCTEQGYTVHTCHRCEDSYVDSYEDALGHAMGDWYTLIETTCVDDGLEQCACERCDLLQERSIPAYGHSYAGVVTEPTCVDGGYTTYTCAACADSYVADEVAAQGHSYESVVTEPTCVDGGYTTYTCAACADSYVADEVAAQGHSYTDTVVDPTFESEGYTLHVCDRCGDNYMDNFVPKLIQYGDVNGDGKVDGRDLLKLKRYLANYDDETGTSTEEVSSGADVNGDGKVDGRDLLKLKRYLANYDDETGTSTEPLGPKN